MRPRHLLCASTSSAYGANTVMPFHETDRAVHPLTLYAASKAANELMGHSYSHLFDIPTTFFRFFTVYGPWERPDLALSKFARAMMDGTPIQVFGNGRMSRDFTFVEDLPDPRGGRYILNFDLWVDRDHRPMGFRVTSKQFTVSGFRDGHDDVKAALTSQKAD
jgi:hypothetical protein